jgi:hypothetical protein
MFDDQGKRYNIHTHSLLEAWNSDHYKNLRLNFLRGGKPESCRGCWQSEVKNKGISTRIGSLERFRIFQEKVLILIPV